MRSANSKVARPSIISKKMPTGTEYEIVLTGKRHRGRIEIILHGTAVSLTCSTFQILLDLILECANSETGYLLSDATGIFRLRKAINKALGENEGKRLIETGVEREYHLTIPRDEVAMRIAVTSSFFELVKVKVVTPQQAEKVRAQLRIV